MAFLESCSYYSYQRDFVSCRKLKIEAYGSVDDGGDQSPRAHFQLRRSEGGEIHTRHPDGMGMIVHKLSHKADAPVYFCNHMEILRKPQELRSWLNCFLSTSSLLEETLGLIFQRLVTFGREMATEALRRGYTRVDFVIHAHEVKDHNYFNNEPDVEIDSEDDEPPIEIDSEDEDEPEFEEIDIEEDDPTMGMVPAAEFYINRLKKTIIRAKRTEEICSVCMSQFSLAEEVAEMPCTHIFHRECIVQWLQRSHFCPICRYEMPTEIQY